MAFTREELDWIEAEWAYHLHGRQAFLSREDFLRLRAWEGEGVPAETLVAAMEAFFARRAQRKNPKSFVALSHLDKDVQKAMSYRRALDRAEPIPATGPGWEQVREPLRTDPKARTAFEAWSRAKAALPAPDAPGFLDAFDDERKAFRVLVELAAEALGPRIQGIEAEVRERLAQARLQEGTRVHDRAWALHRARLVAEAWNLPEAGT